MNRRTWLAAAAAAAALAALWVRTAPTDPLPPRGAGPAATYGDLSLTTAEGPLRLSDLRGQAVVVYFGYTSCPDFCPTTLQTVAAAFQLLAPDERERAAGLFVSLDPARDTPERLAIYTQYFDDRIQGATATAPDIARMASDWGVQYRIVDAPGSALTYAVDHSTQAFLVGPDGALVREIPHGTPATEVATAIRAALRAR